MTIELPSLTLSSQSAIQYHQPFSEWHWDADTANAITLPPLQLADGSGPASQQSQIRLCYDEVALYLRFDCEDKDIWGTFTERDDPIYDEEVVELFLAIGETHPTTYYEFEFSPNGVLFDAYIYNPTGERADMQVDVAWNCAGIRWQAERDDAQNHWSVVAAIPWASIAPQGERPDVWRANFYRIERPRDGDAEYSCWSPTMTEPADFHKAAYFGMLRLKS